MTSQAAGLDDEDLIERGVAAGKIKALPDQRRR
jgi:hypothetical protein